MTELKRMHPATIFISAVLALKEFLLPIIISLFIGTTTDPIGFFRFEYIWIFLLVVAILSGLLRWVFFKYRVSEGQLYIQHGVFIRKKRFIYQHKVQSIDITAGLFQRLFGLVKLKVETAGGGSEPEVSLLAIQKEEAINIRQYLKESFRDETNNNITTTSEDMINDETEDETEVKEYAAPEEQPEFQWHLTNSRLWISALTSSGIGLTLSAVLVLLGQVEQFLPEAIYDRVFSFFRDSGLWLLLFLLFAGFLLAWLISIGAHMLKYGSFKIEKYGNELVISRGIIEKRQLTIALNRVTAVSIEKSILRQPIGFATVYVECAGGGSMDEQLSTVILPIIRPKEIQAIFAEVLPHYETNHTLISIPKRAIFRAMRRMSWLPIVVTAITCYFTSYGYWGILIILLSLLLGYLQYRDGATSMNGDFICLRFRRLKQTTVISEKKKIQSMESHTSFFQKRKRLASIQFSVLSSITGRTYTVVDQDDENVQRILEWYSKESSEKDVRLS
ncbi:PH domain-containing protein [Halalkalibacter sp. APA_J-10(15)]|uniref:PH domain-containing protein n=1 Tax=Halalkalibacter sp. APA_J-10(15) TaxID=2933805 RepID=UPI001FF3DF81|nr:PH domain-containing protein [Halalkalibacter sp. APA_J-10(15)]MCK0472057.1 PH domain-containing protein [Halalkalibacter sp. APA_J-10(15)]